MAKSLRQLVTSATLFPDGRGGLLSLDVVGRVFSRVDAVERVAGAAAGLSKVNFVMPCCSVPTYGTLATLSASLPISNRTTRRPTPALTTT